MARTQPISSKKLSPEDLLRDYTPHIRSLAHELRELVRASVPDVSESANAGWRSIDYRHPVAGYFCSLFPSAGHVEVVFEFGVLLPDPQEILESRGKQVRYVRITLPGDIPRKALARLFRAAVALPQDRWLKIANVKSGTTAEDNTSPSETQPGTSRPHR